MQMTDSEQRTTWIKSCQMWFLGKKQSSSSTSISEYLNTFRLVPDEQNLLWKQVDFHITCHVDKLKLEKNFSFYLQVDIHLGKLNLGLFVRMDKLM